MSALMKLIFPLAAVFAVALACNAFQSAKAADSSVAEFHKLYNESKYEKIYKAGASEFKSAINETAWVNLLIKVKRKLGKEIDSKRTGWHIRKDLIAGTTVTVTEDVQFENAEGKEQFIFRSDGDELKLLRWDVTSPAFSLEDGPADGQTTN